MMPEVSAALLSRYDRPGPRYTSYPTAVEFDPAVDAGVYADHLARAAQQPDEPLALYLHLPFCDERCLFCGCNVVISKQRGPLRRYLDSLKTEIGRVAERLGDRRDLRQYHWGGGTPTYLSTDEMREVHATVTEAFRFEDDAECAIEVDPRVTTPEQLAVLRELGFNRLSMGVQDFTAEVQEAIHRIQPFEMTATLVEEARRLGFQSVNLDLIYGLPHQNPESFARTLQQVVDIRPERIAVYSFAHVPWLKGHQRKIDADTLPDRDMKFELFASAIRGFTQAGYSAVGMDHFALPEDELGTALENGTLWRNFMGYTVRSAPDTVACGMSSIGDVAGAYVQNHSKLVDYERAVEAGGLPVARGYVLAGEDTLRRHVITSLMCTFAVDIPDVEGRFQVDFWRTFANERAGLEPFIEDGFVALHGDRIEVTGLGRLFVRNVCMVFDAHLDKDRGSQPRFSRTV